MLVPRPELMGRYEVFAFIFFLYDNLVLRDQRLYLRLRVDYPSIIRVNRKLFAVLLVHTAQPDFCDFLVRSFLFYLELLLTPLITASYLVASSKARSYGRLKTTCSDRLTWKNRLGREVGDRYSTRGCRDQMILCFVVIMPTPWPLWTIHQSVFFSFQF